MNSIFFEKLIKEKPMFITKYAILFLSSFMLLNSACSYAMESEFFYGDEMAVVHKYNCEIHGLISELEVAKYTTGGMAERAKLYEAANVLIEFGKICSNPAALKHAQNIIREVYHVLNDNPASLKALEAWYAMSPKKSPQRASIFQGSASWNQISPKTAQKRALLDVTNTSSAHETQAPLKKKKIARKLDIEMEQIAHYADVQQYPIDQLEFPQWFTTSFAPVPVDSCDPYITYIGSTSEQ